MVRFIHWVASLDDEALCGAEHGTYYHLEVSVRHEDITCPQCLTLLKGKP